MKRINLFKVLFAATMLIVLEQCSIEPIYYTEITDEVYNSSATDATAQAAVWQIMAVPFDHLRTINGTVPRTYLSASNTFSSDEIVMPNRNGDWYDGGFYLGDFYHNWGASSDAYWVYAYNEGVMQGVAKCWDTYKRLEAIDFNALEFEDGTKEWMLAQVKTMVAYLYLVGLDYFGGLSLYKNVAEGTSSEAVGRSTDLQTFEFIEQTLKEVIPTLKKNDEAFNGYFTQGAAATLLARLYFNARPYIKQNRDADCATVCNKIKEDEYGNYSVENDYRKVFGWDNESSKEFIFGVSSAKSFREVKGGRLEYSSHYNTMVYLDNKEALSWNGFCLTPSLDMYGKKYRTETGNLGGPFKLGCPYAKFEENDIRKQNYVYWGNKEYTGMFLADTLINPITGGVCTADGTREYPAGYTIPMVDQIAQLSPYKVYKGGKFEGAMFAEENSGVRLLKFSPVPNDADNSINFNPDVPLIRYTEIEFMLAEIEFNKGEFGNAAKIINDIRARYFTDEDPNPVPANFDKYRLADEWLIEFIGEGRRRTDLVRWGMFTTESWWDHPADGPGKEYLNRFPIPQSAIDANKKLVQNDGY
ncbi:MAG: RagB/SusD family nutrient uptake outer membrane protein [Prevotellaceae bacterium]|jgi:hypothetical protein|nr:RagB/SusD family nutrient uptake outer membrane protein [Prevotellaceae bacterium]